VCQRGVLLLPPSGGLTQVGIAPNLAFSDLIRGQDTELKIEPLPNSQFW